MMARVIVMMAFRNLKSHRIKSMIVGSIMIFGTALLIFGLSLLDSVEASMQRVVTSSLAGHLQLYSSQGRDKLALFGNLSTGRPDLGEIEDFSKLKEAIKDVPNIKAIVPMGIGVSIGSGGNDIDKILQSLRDKLKTQEQDKIDALKAQVKHVAKVLLDEQVYKAKITSNAKRLEDETAILKRVLSEAFWISFDANPQQALLYLETKLAPLVPDSRPFFIRYMGTDPQLFKQSFDRFEVVKGQMIPPNQRGILISKRVHEKFLKHKVAREFDRLKRARDEDGSNIDEDEMMRGRVNRLPGQYRRILLQLDDRESAMLKAKLSKKFPEAKPELIELIKALLTVTDANFQSRYDYFYEHIAPLIELYRVKVGDVVVLRSMGQRGGLESANVKVWGTFQFKGIENSDLAGTVNITDMLTFRQLYGKMTQEQLKELEQVRKDAKSEDIKQDDVADALFGEQSAIIEEQESEAGGFDEFDGVEIISKKTRKDTLAGAKYKQADLEQGVALNVAIVLEDNRKIEQTQQQLQKVLDAAKMKIRVVDWQEAAGIVGQLIIVIRLILYIAIFIIFSVALIIINNSMVMATMERVSEVGTMRAIGAQRQFVLGLFLLETLVLGVISGILGSLLGVGIVLLLNAIGIPATNDVLRFLFAGPRLHPEVGLGHVLLGMAVIFVVSVASTLYPAIVATRIQPVVAMRGRD